MKRGILVGTSKLFDLREETNLIFCEECSNLFNALQVIKGEIQCPLCRKVILIVKF